MTPAELERLLHEYHPGDRVRAFLRIVYAFVGEGEGRPDEVNEGCLGTVERVTDARVVIVQWDGDFGPGYARASRGCPTSPDALEPVTGGGP